MPSYLPPNLSLPTPPEPIGSYERGMVLNGIGVVSGENRARQGRADIGGGSSLGAAAVARAHPDGYTLLLGGTIAHINEVLLKSRPLYDPIKDLDPISCMDLYTLAIAINPSLPAEAHTLKGFIAYAKANPGNCPMGITVLARPIIKPANCSNHSRETLRSCRCPIGARGR